MTGEPQTTGDFGEEEKTFTYVNYWDERLLMRQKKIGNRTFIFSPEGWELWQRKKDILFPVIQKALKAVEEKGISTRVIYVIKKIPTGLRKEEIEEEDGWYSVIVELNRGEGEERFYREAQNEMEWIFRREREEKIVPVDMQLGENIVILSGYGILEPLLQGCV